MLSDNTGADKILEGFGGGRNSFSVLETEISGLLYSTVPLSKACQLHIV